MPVITPRWHANVLKTKICKLFLVLRDRKTGHLVIHELLFPLSSESPSGWNMLLPVWDGSRAFVFLYGKLSSCATTYWKHSRVKRFKGILCLYVFYENKIPLNSTHRKKITRSQQGCFTLSQSCLLFALQNGNSMRKGTLLHAYPYSSKSTYQILKKKFIFQWWLLLVDLAQAMDKTQMHTAIC